MFKIFRKIRFDLLKENKTVRYLFYAIGEIILVIIGILLALNINNKNELRKQEEKVANILKQIHTDLENSIEELDEVIEFYRAKDSLIYLVLNEQVSEEDYLNPPTDAMRILPFVTNSSQVSKVYDEGFQTLMLNIDALPTKFEPFIHKLNTVFINNKEDLYQKQQLIHDSVWETVDFLMKEKDWFYRWVNFNELPDEAIDYYLYDKLYKNRVTYWSALVAWNYLPDALEFRTNAIDCYNQLTKALNIEESVFQNPPAFMYDSNQFHNYLGKYINNKDTVQIRIEENDLIYDLNQDNVSKIYLLSDTHFYNRTQSGFYSFRRDKNGSVSDFTIHKGSILRIFKKVE